MLHRTLLILGMRKDCGVVEALHTMLQNDGVKRRCSVSRGHGNPTGSPRFSLELVKRVGSMLRNETSGVLMEVKKNDSGEMASYWCAEWGR
ncbi:MAG: hypothetical protein C0478_01950 [Planctomyces sp.]|nr:hypothetical protein [Planctomyces sp.]